MTRYKSGQLSGNRLISSERQDLHAVVEWLKVAYPSVIFHFDFGADALLTPRQAAERKKLSWGRGWPDLLIFEPRAQFVGLAIDLKREDVNLYNSKGFFKNDHIERQAEVLFQLRCRGWETDFVKGFDAARGRIAGYLSIG